MNIDTIIVAILTFLFMSAVAMFVQWVNDNWSIWGTGPMVAALFVVIYLTHRWEKRHGSLLNREPPDFSEQSKDPEQ